VFDTILTTSSSPSVAEGQCRSVGGMLHYADTVRYIT